MLRLAFDFIITWRETRTRPNAYKPTLLDRCSTVDVFPLLDGYEAIPAPTAEYMTALSDFRHLLIYLKSGPYSNQNTIAQSWSLANGS